MGDDQYYHTNYFTVTDSFRLRWGELIASKNDYLNMKRRYNKLGVDILITTERYDFIKDLLILFEACEDGIIKVNGKNITELKKYETIVKLLRRLNTQNLNDSELFDCYSGLRAYMVASGILDAGYKSAVGLKKITEKYNLGGGDNGTSD